MQLWAFIPPVPITMAQSALICWFWTSAFSGFVLALVLSFAFSAFLLSFAFVTTKLSTRKTKAAPFALLALALALLAFAKLHLINFHRHWTLTAATLPRLNHLEVFQIGLT